MHALFLWCLAIVPVFLAACLACGGWVLKRLFSRLEGLDKRLDTMTTDLAVVKKEVLPNSGSSLRDALHRVETDVAVLKATQPRTEVNVVPHS